MDDIEELSTQGVDVIAVAEATIRAYHQSRNITFLSVVEQTKTGSNAEDLYRLEETKPTKKC